ncbi:hypothetical protein FHT77_000743 [Rhizobium sp. BK181]|uniref:hypothetical protein n=1 Tax=Rhizobium sp. BK181 TaxID=2587072 RepID=UPI00161C55A3|nr:hypothetical protein [Rhizobium sp. BK181]MBB3314901.1 hypothetical protein [Rhizobium sp. BK181]
MITLIAIAQIADLLNDSRDKYSAKAESEFYESVGNSSMVRFAAFLMSPQLNRGTLRPRGKDACRSGQIGHAACLARS